MPNDKLAWKLSNGPLRDIGFAIAGTISEIVSEQMSTGITAFLKI